jgi:hypothetical protein
MVGSVAQLERARRELLITHGELPECGPMCGLPNSARRVHAHDNQCVYRDPDAVVRNAVHKAR